jgi:hypothetical protein
LAPDAIAARVRRRFVSGRHPVLDDQLAQARGAAGLRATDRVERRATVIAALDGRSLVFEGKVVTVPARATTALAAASAATAPFTAADLPGPLDVPSRLVLVRRLVREGFLRAVA